MGGHNTFIQLRLDDAQRFAITNSRRFDQETSIAAAESVSKRAPIHRARVLRIHADHPEGLSDFELAAKVGIQQTSCGKRRLELVRLGFIEKTKETRASPTGSPAIVWKITDAGIAYERAHRNQNMENYQHEQP